MLDRSDFCKQKWLLSWQNCFCQQKYGCFKRRGVQLSHQSATNQKLKALFNRDFFCKTWPIEPMRYITCFFFIQIVFKNQWTPFSNAVYGLVLVLTTAIWAYTVVPPGDNIHSYYRTTVVTNNCCALGLIDCAPALKYFNTRETARAPHTLAPVGQYRPG